MNAVNNMAEYYEMPIIYSVHPRSAKFIKAREFRFHPLVRQMPPFSFSDYSALLRSTYCVVSDSGTMPEEAAIEGFPGVCIRTSTERPESLDKGCYVIGGIEGESILRAVDMAVRLAAEGSNGADVPDYANDDVSSVALRIIASYTPIVNDRVWRKNG